MTGTLTLTNDYHHTSARVRPTLDGVLSPAQVARVRRTLCGVDSCTCGDALGTRGLTGWWIQAHQDGGATVLPPWRQR